MIDYKLLFLVCVRVCVFIFFIFGVSFELLQLCYGLPILIYAGMNEPLGYMRGQEYLLRANGPI
ncbi:hypothetical protein Hanom_Chr16g01483351 [Helianthus anomalus]